MDWSHITSATKILRSTLCAINLTNEWIVIAGNWLHLIRVQCPLLGILGSKCEPAFKAPPPPRFWNIYNERLGGWESSLYMKFICFIYTLFTQCKGFYKIFVMCLHLTTHLPHEVNCWVFHFGNNFSYQTVLHLFWSLIDIEFSD